MKRSLILAIAGLVLAAPRALAGPGEVTAVSVLPGAGRVNVVIDVRGSVSVQDFTLENPARLVIDVLGATLDAPALAYDGQNRGGIVDIRYAQFRPDVVRIVLELENLRDYELEYSDDAVRVAFGSDRSFAAWTSTAPAEYAAAVERATSSAVPALDFQGQQPRVTASYDSASIADVMAGFAELSGKSIVLGSSVSGFVTARINNQPWDVALRTILDSRGLAAFEEPIGVIRVEQRSTVFSQDSLRRASEPLVTQVVPINYARAAALAPVMASIVTPDRGRVVVDTGTNSLIITDIESRLDENLQYLRDLDRRTAQVSIQAKLILVNRTGIEQLGLKYDLGDQGANQTYWNTVVARQSPFTPGEFLNPTETPFLVTLSGTSVAAVANANSSIVNSALDIIFNTAIGSANLSAFLQAVQETRLSDLQAEPLISTADNTAARIQVGEDTPIRILEAGAQQAQAQATVEFRETGIILEVTPHVTNNRQVLLDIRAENSALQSAASDLGYTFVKQSAENQILVDDGQTAVIGGLTVTQVTQSKTGIPYLVDLPIVGRLFGFTSRTETRQDLLILVTPHITDDPLAETAGG